MKHILVPTDGSEAACKALDIALDMAGFHDASVAIVHILLKDKDPQELLRLPDLQDAEGDLVSALTSIEQAPELERSAEDIMGHPERPNRLVDDALLRKIGAHVIDQARRRAADRGVEVRLLDIQDNEPAAAIVATASHENVDTIVMGTRGLRGIEAMTFGSVSQDVCRTAGCTVVAVH